jgi:hypothetical protein
MDMIMDEDTSQEFSKEDDDTSMIDVEEEKDDADEED